MEAGLEGTEFHTSEDLGWSLRSTVIKPPLAGFTVALGDPDHLWISLQLPSRDVSICCPDCAQLRQQQMGPSGGGLPHFLPSVADMGDWAQLSAGIFHSPPVQSVLVSVFIVSLSLSKHTYM